MARVYEVRAEVVLYVVAEDERAALRRAEIDFDEEARNLTARDMDVVEVTRIEEIDARWTPDSLVYGTDTDTTLAEALAGRA